MNVGAPSDGFHYTYDPDKAYYTRNVFAEETIEVPINDAVYERNQYLESVLGITIKPIQVSETRPAIETSCRSNLDTYDFCFTAMTNAPGSVSFTTARSAPTMR